MILFHLICPAGFVNNYRFTTQQIFSTAYNTTLSCVVIFNHAVNTIGRKKNDCLFVSTWIKILHMCLCYPILQGSNRYNTKWPCFKSPLHWKIVRIERPPPLGWVTRNCCEGTWYQSQGAYKTCYQSQGVYIAFLQTRLIQNPIYISILISRHSIPPFTVIRYPNEYASVLMS